MAKRMGKTDIEQFDIAQYRKRIPKNSAVISYANSNTDKLVIMVATNDKTVALEISTSDFIKRIKDKYNDEIESVDKKLSGQRKVVIKNGVIKKIKMMPIYPKKNRKTDPTLRR